MAGSENKPGIIDWMPLASGGVSLVVIGAIGEKTSIDLAGKSSAELVQANKTGYEPLFHQANDDFMTSVVGGLILSPATVIVGVLAVRKAWSVLKQSNFRGKS